MSYYGRDLNSLNLEYIYWSGVLLINFFDNKLVNDLFADNKPVLVVMSLSSGGILHIK